MRMKGEREKEVFKGKPLGGRGHGQDFVEPLQP